MKIAISIICISLAFAVASAAPEPSASLSEAVDQLLAAYSSKNVEQFLALTDPTEILVLGTDISEIADSKDKVRELLTADFRLWGAAEFGKRSFTSTRVSEHLASVAFDVPFTMHRTGGTSDTMTIRFLTVWKESGDRWLLTQSLNSVPSVGHSASDLAKSPAPK